MNAQEQSHKSNGVANTALSAGENGEPSTPGIRFVEQAGRELDDADQSASELYALILDLIADCTGEYSGDMALEALLKVRSTQIALTNARGELRNFLEKEAAQ